MGADLGSESSCPYQKEAYRRLSIGSFLADRGGGFEKGGGAKHRNQAAGGGLVSQRAGAPCAPSEFSCLTEDHAESVCATESRPRNIARYFDIFY